MVFDADSTDILQSWKIIAGSRALYKAVDSFDMAIKLLDGRNNSLDDALSVLDFLLDCKESEELDIVKSDLTHLIMKLRNEQKKPEEEMLELWTELKTELRKIVVFTAEE